MVKEIEKQGTILCQCEEWCKKTNSCSLEITKHAIKN